MYAVYRERGDGCPPFASLPAFKWRIFGLRRDFDFVATSMRLEIARELLAKSDSTSSSRPGASQLDPGTLIRQSLRP